jgi:pimeloyl-ACP methyl ester carboxylesterase
MGNLVNKMAFLPPPPQEIGARNNVIWLTTKQKYIVPAIHVRCPRQPSRFTILFSHGNAEDLGCIERWLEELAAVCNADIFAYDYPGYGLSRNSKSGTLITMNEAGTFGAADAAYEYLTKEANIRPHNIVAFGR